MALDSNFESVYEKIAGVIVKVHVYTQDYLGFSFDRKVTEYSYHMGVDLDFDPKRVGLKSLEIYTYEDADRFWFHIDIAIPVQISWKFESDNLNNKQSNLTLLYKHQGEFFTETFYQEDGFSISNIEHFELSSITSFRKQGLRTIQFFNLGSDIYEIVTLEGGVLFDVLKKASQSEIMQFQFDIHGYPGLKYRIIEMNFLEKQAINDMSKVFEELTKSK